MKVGFVLDDGLDKPDGVQQYILTLGNQLMAKGHTVRYLVGETRQKQADNQTKIYSLAKNVKVSFNGNVLSVPWFAAKKKIKAVINEENFDVLHVQAPYSPFMGAKIIKYSSPHTAIVGTFHILPYGWLSRAGTRLLGFILKPTIKKFDSFIAVSQPAADFALSSFKIDCQVIPNMVDTSQFKAAFGPGNQSQGLRLLFLGRLVDRKGCRQLVEALGILKKQNRLPPDALLDICGDGPMRGELESFVISNSLSGHVNFHGFVTDDQKIKFMQSADISIFPSLSGESFGIVLIEAMAAGGGVVLAGNNPGYRSVMSSLPGSLIEAQKPDIMAQQLENLIKDTDKRASLYKQQQAHVKHFDAAVVAERVISVYRSCKIPEKH